MESLEAELDRARDLDVAALADSIESIGFECTRCGGCCTGYAPDEPGGAPAGEGVNEGGTLDATGATDDVDATDRTEGMEGGDCHDADADTDEREPHTATVFPDEVRELQAAASDRFGGSYDWRDVARPMPYGLHETAGGSVAGETFEWALATDDCGDCTFYDEDDDGLGACTVHESRPLICRTYPFSVDLGGTTQPMGEAVDAEGMVRAHECEGLGRDVDREAAESLAAALKERAVRELEEAIAVRNEYDPTAARRTSSAVVIHDSEGAKRSDGTAIGSADSTPANDDDVTDDASLDDH